MTRVCEFADTRRCYNGKIADNDGGGDIIRQRTNRSVLQWKPVHCSHYLFSGRHQRMARASHSNTFTDTVAYRATACNATHSIAISEMSVRLSVCQTCGL